MMEYRHQISDEESSRIQRFLRLLAAGTAVFGLLVLVAFLTADRWLLLISHEGERKFVDRYVMLVKESLLHSSEPLLQDYVTGLTEQIAAQLDTPDALRIRVHVVRGRVVNAGATLGCHIFIPEGLLRRLNSENGVAMVLAHELAHCVNRDPLRSAGRAFLWAIAVSSMQGTDLPGQDFGGSRLMLNAYSRQQELAADRQALTALQSHYGHIGGATHLFEVLLKSGSADGNPEVLSTHPGLDLRIKTINTMARDNGWRTLTTSPYPPAVIEALSSKP